MSSYCQLPECIKICFLKGHLILLLSLMKWGSFILLWSLASCPFLGWKQRWSPLPQLAFIFRLSAACSISFVETVCALLSLFGIGYILFFLSTQLMVFCPCTLVLTGIELFLFIDTMFWICDENRHTDGLVIAEQCLHNVMVFSASPTALPVSVLGVHKRLRGETAGTDDPKWLKRYSKPVISPFLGI